MIEFEDTLRKSRAYNLIKNDIDTGNLSHAYMIISPDSYVMRPFFALVACAVFCKNDACLECTACEKVLHGNNSDIKYINELEKNVTVDEIRSFLEDTSIKPFEGDNKLYFFYSADKISMALQNKMLKTIEEPEKTVTIFLGVGRESAMLDTVKSRTKKIILDRFSEGDILYEMQKMGIETEQAIMASACADGMLGKALEIAKDKSFADMYDKALYLLTNLKKSGDVTSFLGDKALNRDNLPAFLDILSIIIRDMQCVKSDKNLIMSKHKESDIVRLAESYSERALSNILYLINEERKKLSFNVGAMGIAENLLLGILEVKFKCQ